MALSFNPANPKSLQKTTCSVTGGANNTSYILSVSSPHGTGTMNFTTDGSGAASLPMYFPGSGSYSFTVTPASASSSATATVTVGGFS